jgi:hypothetical protein
VILICNETTRVESEDGGLRGPLYTYRDGTKRQPNMNVRATSVTIRSLMKTRQSGSTCNEMCLFTLLIYNTGRVSTVTHGPGRSCCASPGPVHCVTCYI